MTEVAQLIRLRLLIGAIHITTLLGEDGRFASDSNTAEFYLLVGIEHSHSDHGVVAGTKLLPLLLRVSCLPTADPRSHLGLLRISRR